jgi:hypothetical protein
MNSENKKELGRNVCFLSLDGQTLKELMVSQLKDLPEITLPQLSSKYSCGIQIGFWERKM